MRRRAFLGIIPLLVGSISLRGFKIPQLAYRDGKPSVQWYLTQLYNRQFKRTSYQPRFVFVSEWLRDKYESELVSLQRYTTKIEGVKENYQFLYFKSTKMIALKSLKGWQVEMV